MFDGVAVVGLGDALGGSASWALSTLLPTLVIYAILVSALNVQWGYIGIFNFGVVAFFMVGAYTTAVLLAPPPGEFRDYIYVFEALLPRSWDEATRTLALQLLIPAAWLCGAAMAALLAVFISGPVLRLRADYLAIVTIGIAEVLRTVVKATAGLVNQDSGIGGIPRFIADYSTNTNLSDWIKLGVLVGVLALVLLTLWAMTSSPWGRALRALRDSEQTAQASGKKVAWFRLQAFIVGAALMGLAGGLYVTTYRGASPSLFQDISFTFLVWAMLVVGGSGRLKGALVGVLLVGTLWFGVDLLQSLFLSDVSPNFFVAFRQIVIGLAIVLFTVFRPQGLMPEQAKVSRFIPWTTVK